MIHTEDMSVSSKRHEFAAAVAGTGLVLHVLDQLRSRLVCALKTVPYAVRGYRLPEKDVPRHTK